MKSVNKNVSMVTEHNGKYPCPNNDINISETHLELTSKLPPAVHRLYVRLKPLDLPVWVTHADVTLIGMC